MGQKKENLLSIRAPECPYRTQVTAKSSLKCSPQLRIQHLVLAHRIYKSTESPAMITDTRFLFRVTEKMIPAFGAFRVKGLAVITNANIFLSLAKQMTVALCTLGIESLAMIAIPLLLFSIAEQGAIAFLTGSHGCSPLFRVPSRRTTSCNGWSQKPLPSKPTSLLIERYFCHGTSSIT